jgi:heme/copper-type cytochrome/quinol oxidase subunit 2
MKMQAKLLLSLLFVAAPAQAAYVDDDYEIDVNNQGFENPRLEVPANQRIKLEVDNESDAVVEFYIPAIDLEIAVPAHTEREFFVDGFAPGEYAFENELKSDMRGTLVAK